MVGTPFAEVVDGVDIRVGLLLCLVWRSLTGICLSEKNQLHFGRVSPVVLVELVAAVPDHLADSCQSYFFLERQTTVTNFFRHGSLGTFGEIIFISHVLLHARRFGLVQALSSFLPFRWSWCFSVCLRFFLSLSLTPPSFSSPFIFIVSQPQWPRRGVQHLNRCKTFISFLESKRAIVHPAIIA